MGKEEQPRRLEMAVGWSCFAEIEQEVISSLDHRKVVLVLSSMMMLRHDEGARTVLRIHRGDAASTYPAI